ncbi:hypothetical protein E4K72_04805 [Oxalobacteraceae bacterium OM1]|nr:hypothetical protein E4K72_04805 [Oxalobacteraceae bacterium OM1]
MNDLPYDPFGRLPFIGSVPQEHLPETPASAAAIQQSVRRRCERRLLQGLSCPDAEVPRNTD